MLRRTRFLALSTASAIATSSALATWSIILTDTRTGEVAVGSCTCLESLDLQQLTPVMLVGVGGATAQSFGDTSGQNRTYIRDALLRGLDPTQIITGLAAFDTGHQTRQYGILDITGRTATFTGTGDGQWAGGRTGSFDYDYLGKRGTIAYAIQGNVLTGAPVVDQAVAAVRNTPGDLAARFMAAMQAARAMGGDGRCSCSSGSPTVCGSPPPPFALSAQIGYMLIARTGDRNGSHGMYKASTNPIAVAAADLSGDGRPDLVSINTGTNINGVLSFVNAGASRELPAFVLPFFNAVSGNRPADLALADVTGDNLADALVVNSLGNTIGMYRGQGNGRFVTAVTMPTVATPTSIVAANFDGTNGRDIAICALGTGGAGVVTVRLNDGTGAFGAATDYPVGIDPRRILAADLDGDQHTDLIIALRTDSRIKWLRGNGDGTLQPAADLAIVPLPTSIAITDLNGNGSLDIAVAAQGVIANGRSGIVVLSNIAGTFTATQTIDTVSQPNDILIGDINRDSLPDLVSPLNDGTVVTYHRTPAGGFGPPITSTVWTSPLGRGALTDLDGDGDLDGAFVVPANGTVAVVRNIGGRFESGIGNAFGDYFMSFDYSQSAVDPVVYLQNQYDDWRTTLAGRPDAVQSVVSAPGVLLPARSPRTLRVSLRDWSGAVSSRALVGASVQVLDGPSPRVSISSPRFVGPDVVEFGVIGIATGNSTLRITVDDGLRPVTLMPDTRIRVRACLADANDDGGVTIDDLSTILVQFEAGTVAADLDGDGGVTLDDLLEFLEAYDASC